MRTTFPSQWAARWAPRLAAAAAIVAITALSAHAQDEVAPEASLPPGPKQLLLDLTSAPAPLMDMAGASRSAEEWLAQLGEGAGGLSEEQLLALAEYLALNLPPAEPVTGEDAATIVAGLPADGQELFVANCFACHTVASYYLLQDRDVAGWMTIFDAPYHRRLLTGDNERETFASYAAYAMPIAEADIPEAWRE